jgi:hypothetical protein
MNPDSPQGFYLQPCIIHWIVSAKNRAAINSNMRIIVAYLMAFFKIKRRYTFERYNVERSSCGVGISEGTNMNGPSRQAGVWKFV